MITFFPTSLASNTQNQTYFYAKIPRSFFGFPCKDMCYLSYIANVNIIIIDFHQKYAEVKSLRRSGEISNILLSKKLIWNLSLFQVASLYNLVWEKVCNLVNYNDCLCSNVRFPWMGFMKNKISNLLRFPLTRETDSKIS